MKAIPNYRAADLKPYLNFFQSIGAPVECGLSQHRLPITMDYADDLYLPQFPTLAFLECMEKKRGIDELPLRALHDLQITDLNKYFVSKAHQSPTLLAALVHFNRLLRDTDKKTTEIAFVLGYEDSSHFSRAFKRLSGISPCEYRYQQLQN